MITSTAAPAVTVSSGAVAAPVSVVGAGVAVALPVARGWRELEALPPAEPALLAVLAVLPAVVVPRLA